MGCKCGDKFPCSHTEAGGQIGKVKEKWRKRISGIIQRDYSIGWVSHDGPQKHPVVREDDRLGSNYTVRFSKTTMRPAKNREKRCPSWWIFQHCEPQERVPWAPKFEERIPRQERCARKAAWNSEKDVDKSKRCLKKRLTLLPKFGKCLQPLDKSRRATTRNRMWSFYAYGK